MLRVRVLVVWHKLLATSSSPCPLTAYTLSSRAVNGTTRAIRDHASGCSSSKAMITPWAFLRNRFRRYSRALRDRAHAKGLRPINVRAAGKTSGEEWTGCMRKLSDAGNVEKLSSVVPAQDSPPIFSLPDHSSLMDSSSASEGHSTHNQGSSGCRNSASRYFPGSLPPGLTDLGPPWNPDSVVSTTSADVRPLPSLPGQDKAEGIRNLLGGSPTPPTTLTAVHPSFWPLAPEQIQRYAREIVIRPDEKTYWIDPLTTSFPPHHIQHGWTPFAHPEGALYWFHQEKRSFTGVDLRNGEKLQRIMKYLDDIYEFIHKNHIIIRADVDLVFEIVKDPDSGEECCAYYFASHDTRSIFWLDDFDMNYLITWDEVKGVTEPSHVGLEIEAQYWYHCQLFPTCMEMTMDIVEELRDILIYNMGGRFSSSKLFHVYFFHHLDTMTSPLSNSVYGVSELQEIMGITNCIEKSITSGLPRRPGSVGSIGRFMFIFFRNRFINFHGQPGARLARDQLIYETSSKRTLLVTLLSPLLFFTPDIHLVILKKIGGDGHVHTNKASWTNFTQNLNTEWQEVTLYATVLLNANVAFLAIQSVDDASADGGRSSAQIASYISVIASIGSIILGTRMRVHDSSGDSRRFLRLQKRNNRGMETLAIMYGLPTALLMWAVVSFLVAFSIICFAANSLSDRMLVGGTWIVVGVLIVWCIIAFWEIKQVHVPYMSILSVRVKYWHRLPRNLVKKFQTSRMKAKPPMNSVGQTTMGV
ncbi:hypothetical protein EDD18DRAFT_291769 [Armillaria luteobubalina]|uniref:WW domain-containing protein n=1 Tax=Armillaria luteobubalina TaxID=153913 RepID=A0AA39Q3P8_9AGAR|nr:hypothetical protein EDD18DRAFT_291769 [Armillaria luteobubalina]